MDPSRICSSSSCFHRPPSHPAKTRSRTRRNNMKQFRIIIICLAIVALIYIGPGMFFKWTAERVFVGPDEALMVVNKFGDPLPSDMIVVPSDANHYKGIQEELRGPGRYFLNPVEYDWNIVPLVKIPAGDPEQWAWDENGKIKDA